MSARTVSQSFEWDMDAATPVPIPVAEIEGASSCDELNSLLNQWASRVGNAPGEARRTEAAAFAQHAADTMVSRSCEISLDS